MGTQHYDVAIVGSGLSGMATAARLQAAGKSTVVLEAHSVPGGCTGYYRRSGFSFDVGATTLVDFEPGGVGGELLDNIGMPKVDMDVIPGYRAWLPDRTVNLYRDTRLWHSERLALLGDSAAHRKFWHLVDTLADVFWNASRDGIALPLHSSRDFLNAARIIAPQHWLKSRHLNQTLGNSLRSFKLRDEKALSGLLSMIVEDTVHAKIDEAPLINAAMGITMRGAGLSRARGGMRGFITSIVTHYSNLGGRFIPRNEVLGIKGESGSFKLESSLGCVSASQVVCAIPAENAALISPLSVQSRLRPYLERDALAMGGGFVVFLGVPEGEVKEHEWTHHQVLMDYDLPLGLGNNMFISVSAVGDKRSAPEGHRSVMISTHCELDEWTRMDKMEYASRKKTIAHKLLSNARRVYPNLGSEPVVFESGTPRTYARFARRPDGAVGGVRQTLSNSNQNAIPHDIGVEGFHLVGDSTWPGLGTVACVLGSRIVTGKVLSQI